MQKTASLNFCNPDPGDAEPQFGVEARRSAKIAFLQMQKTASLNFCNPDPGDAEPRRSAKIAFLHLLRAVMQKCNFCTPENLTSQAHSG